MIDPQKDIARLEEGLRQVQAANWALKQLVLAMLAQQSDINLTMRQFLKITDEINTHNIYSKLPEDFVRGFSEEVRLLVQEYQAALQRAPEVRAERDSDPRK